MEEAEARVAEIDEVFCRPGYYEETPAEDVQLLEEEREQTRRRVDGLMKEWEDVERSLDALAEEAVGG